MSEPVPVSRREFLRHSTAVAAGATVGAGWPSALRGHAKPGRADPIRIGVIGCGGRGSGAALNALEAAEDVRLVALADLFADRVESAYERLRGERPDIDIPDGRRFSGWDAHEQLLALDEINYVILATPPGFRPIHLRAAVEAGKHVFAEKPIAVDAPGVRAALEAGERAGEKGLGIVAGTQYRHDAAHIETIGRVQDGAIGELVAAYAYYNMGGLWHRGREPEWTDVEWQIRNWLYFTWLSGDHIVEQFVHNLDTMNWVLGEHPLVARGMGGRQARTGPEYGHIYDHFAVEYVYPSGVVLSSQARQIDGCERRIENLVLGTRGRSDCRERIEPRGDAEWAYDGPAPNPYVQEHADLIASIRAGSPLNETQAIAESTLTAIMGRMAAYSGQAIDWETASSSQESLMPADLEFGPLPTQEVPIPGKHPVP